MPTLFFRNPRLTLLTVGLILVAGAAALQSLARQEDPALSRRFGSVVTFYPGADALRVESLVTEKLEAELQELHEIVEIDSLSRTGVSVINLELDDRYDESNVDEVWSKVRDRLRDAETELPAGAARPDFEDRTSTAVTLVAALVWERQDEPPLGLLSRLAEELEARLRNLPGTKQTERFGEAEEEVRVGVDPVALAAVNLTAADVSRAIAGADSKRPAGQLRGDRNDLLLEVEGELDSLARIRSVPLRREGDGRLLRVGDIASVEKGVREPPATVALLGGLRGVAVAATMEPGRRVDRWSEAAREVVEAFRSEVPSGVGYALIFDQSVYTRDRLGALLGNLVLGAAIVVAVLVFMMGTRSALIVASALPLTLAAVLAELAWMGIPLHQMSITGLIIALGLLIDNAIVVVDEFELRRRAGAGREEALARTVRHLFVPLTASTLTTVLAFLPIALMPGGAGEFVGPIAIGVGLSVVTSYALSLTVIGAFAARLAPEPGRAEGGRWWQRGYSHPRLTDAFRRSLRLTLRRPAVGVAVSVALPAIGFAVAGTLGEQFFPANDRDQFQLQLVLPAQTSIAETRSNAVRARELLHRHEAVVESHWFLGEAPPRVYYNLMANEDGVSSYAGAFVTTRSSRATRELLPRLQAELTEAFPNARVLALPFEQGPPFEAPIEVRLVGPDLEVLGQLGDGVRALLAETDEVTFTTAKLAAGAPKLRLATDEDEARGVGLRLSDIADQLNARLEGAEGGSVLEASQEMPVRVQVGTADRGSWSQIAAGRVLAPSRRADTPDDVVPGVPLSVISEMSLVPEFAGVTRRNGERVNTVQAFLTPYALIADSLTDFRRRLEAADFQLPAGYRIEFGGEAEQRSDALADLAAFALPLFVVMAGAIVLSFNSFRLAGIVFCVAFLSVGLAMFGVWLFGHPLGFLAIVGTMGLVGLAINGAIVVLSALRADPEARRADVEASVQVVVDASRHILATTLTTIGGFLPLILFGGRFWPPMATAIAGGVAGASILALYLTPSLHMAICRRDLARKRKRASAAIPPPRAAAFPA